MTAAKRRAQPTRRSAGTHRGRQRPKQNLVLPIALGLVAVLAIVAVVLSRGSSDGEGDGGPVETAPVEVSGDALPDYGDGADLARGMAAPTARGEALDGSAITVGGAGEAQVIFFVAHWCPHCQKEVPVISDWIAEEGMPEGVALKGVSTGVDPTRGNYPPSRWFEREDWPVDTLIDSEDAKTANVFGLPSYPYFVALDREGKIVARATGELTVAQIEALVNAAGG